MTGAERVALLRAEIKDELTKLKRLRADYATLSGRIDFNAVDLPVHDRIVVGYYLHNFYNGCEAIFLSVARFFENDVPADSWHADLLKRMKLEISGVRPRVIDDRLFHLLEDFRAFRHEFRHLYTFELDWAREARRPEARSGPQTTHPPDGVVSVTSGGDRARTLALGDGAAPR